MFLVEVFVLLYYVGYFVENLTAPAAFFSVRLAVLLIKIVVHVLNPRIWKLFSFDNLLF